MWYSRSPLRSAKVGGEKCETGPGSWIHDVEVVRGNRPERPKGFVYRDGSIKDDGKR